MPDRMSERTAGRMSVLRSLPALLLLILVTGGCIRREVSRVEVMTDVMASPDLRTATNLPSEFAVVSPPERAGDCPTQLTDAGLNTVLRLHRSVLRQAQDSTGSRSFGDYSVKPSGQYGEREGEGLRVDCARMQAIGVIRL